jgi:hypothetical protein
MSSSLRLGICALLLVAGSTLYACAQDAASLDDPGLTPDGAQDAAAADTSLPPPSGDDSGTPTQDSSQPQQDSAQPPQDSAPPVDSAPPPDAGPPPDAAPLPNGNCDTSSQILSFVYGAEYAAAVFNSTLTPCPCSATECCYPNIIPGCISR